jgi:hypothetical protein
MAKRASHSMAGVISLKPILNIPDESFSKLSAKIELTNSYKTSYNSETTALKIPDQFCFLFGVYCNGFFQGYPTYELKVNVSKI